MQICGHSKRTQPGFTPKLPGTNGAGGQPPIQTEPAHIEPPPEKTWGIRDSLRVGGSTILNGFFPGPGIAKNLLPPPTPPGDSVLSQGVSVAKNLLKSSAYLAINMATSFASAIATLGIAWASIQVSAGQPVLSALASCHPVALGAIALTGLCTVVGAVLGGRETKEHVRSQIEKHNEQEVERVDKANEHLKMQHQDALALLKPNGVYRGLEQTPETLTMYLSDGGALQLAGDKAVAKGERLSGEAKLTKKGVEFFDQGLNQTLLTDGSWNIHLHHQGTRVEVATQGSGSLKQGQAWLPGFDQPQSVKVDTERQAMTILSTRFDLPAPLDLGR